MKKETNRNAVVASVRSSGWVQFRIDICRLASRNPRYAPIAGGGLRACRVLADAVLRSETHAYLGAVSRELDCPPEIIGGMADHVHTLVRLGRTITIVEYVKEAKWVTTAWLQPRAPALRDFNWQAGYGAISVSSSNLPEVIEYIRNQAEHHRVRTFQEEFRSLLERHGITIDERYVWD